MMPSIDHYTATPGVKGKESRKALTRTKGQNVDTEFPTICVGELTSHVEYNRIKYSHMLL